MKLQEPSTFTQIGLLTGPVFIGRTEAELMIDVCFRYRCSVYKVRDVFTIVFDVLKQRFIQKGKYRRRLLWLCSIRKDPRGLQYEDVSGRSYQIGNL